VKLFEFEILEEGVIAVLNIKDICILINEHLPDQEEARNIPRAQVREVIKKIPDFRNKFAPLDSNTKFYIWSKSKKMGIGLRKRDDKDGYQRVEVMTAVNKDYDSAEVTFFTG